MAIASINARLMQSEASFSIRLGRVSLFRRVELKEVKCREVRPANVNSQTLATCIKRKKTQERSVEEAGF